MTNNHNNTDHNNNHDNNGDDDYRCKQLVATSNRPKKISHVQFGSLSATEMQRLSEFQVVSRELFQMPSRTPARGGCLDSRLGVSDKVSICQTCGRKLLDCAGHFGYVRLALPVFHIGFIKHTLQLLQCICKTCSRVLLPDETRRSVLKKMRRSTMDPLSKQNLFQNVVLAGCKKMKQCPYCHSYNGTVKKLTGISTLKIIHVRHPSKPNTKQTAAGREAMDQLRSQLESSMESNPQIAPLLQNGSTAALVQDLLPTTVLALFSKIPDDDCEVLWTVPLLGGRPENLILQHLLVPPVPIRPSVAMDVGGGSNEDDLTVKLQEIIGVNVALTLALSKGLQTRTIVEEWDFLQTQVAAYMNGDMPGLAKPLGTKPIRGLCQRLKGKQGRFRGNLSGKRVDFSARTVISPDPNLGVQEVGVPLRIAKIMTYPEQVSRCNKRALQQCVRNGPNKWPGANLLRKQGSGLVQSLAFCQDLRKAAQQLQYGDIVERHLTHGDIVLFNRQPSLHRISIMAHQARVMEWRTFRFNICVCAPYNADFDGDEMNLHLPQTPEARTEAKELLGVVDNLTTPRNGEPLVAASQDFLSASYLLTQKFVFYNRNDTCRLCSYFGNADEHVQLPPPAIVKPVMLWTGKQIFSLCLQVQQQEQSSSSNDDDDETNKEQQQHSSSDDVTQLQASRGYLVSLECPEKNYEDSQHFCPNDGYVSIRNSELVSGNVAKKTIGDGSKKGLIFCLLRDCGKHAAARFLNRWARFCARYFGFHKGWSIGISDVTPSEKLLALKQSILKEGYRKASERIAEYERGDLALRPGCDLLQSLEEVLNGILGKLRESAGQQAMKALEWDNTPRIMAECGSKGSPLNISQMIACVGQQAVGGMRIQNGFNGRTLPHFPLGALSPDAKGFVANSFCSGLTATEFFFHTMGGREGLVDTAVKTAETGYMARRLMKALEDLSLQYDGSVRNSETTVVQFVYGDDFLSPTCMEDHGQPIAWDRLLLALREVVPCREEGLGYGPDELCQALEEELVAYTTPCQTTEQYRTSVRTFIHSVAEEQRKIRCDIEDLDDDDEPLLLQATWNTCRMTPTQLTKLLQWSCHKFTKAIVEAGEAVGAMGAQSISEPGTQMTLKTFHFAGVSSMNVTLGVPRLKEIINASKLISTPIITARLDQSDNVIGARLVKATIEKTTLGEISTSLKEVYHPNKCYISIELHMETMEQLKLNLDAHSVRKSILASRQSPVLRLLCEPNHVQVSKKYANKLRVMMPDGNTTGTSSQKTLPPTTFFRMQAFKSELPKVIVQGIPTISRAVINEEDAAGGSNNNKKNYHLLVEGYGLADVMGSPGVKGTETTTNHIMEVEQVLGVEAARHSVAGEISYIMNAYGIGIDHRHLLLLSDVMTFKGEVLGITRFGVSKMKESVLMLASFEKTTDHLFDAAVHGRTDAIVGVSECIIMGIPIPLGTGLLKLLHRATVPVVDKKNSKNSPKVPAKLLLK